MLSKKTKSAFLIRLKTLQASLSDYKPTSQLHALEARYTLFCIESILSSRGGVSTSVFKTFLKNRWAMIKNTDIQYLHDFTNPANQMCIEIAKKLGEILSKPYLILLMPSLCALEPWDYLMSTYEHDLPLTNLVLSDNNQQLIIIPEVFDGALRDGVLKHNSLFCGKVKKLSSTEECRVLSRHQTVQEFYDAFQARVQFKMRGDSAGAALTRLIIGLRQGGEQENGCAYDSGAEANVAIIEFAAYIKKLDVKSRKTVMTTKVDDANLFGSASNRLSIKRSWARLARTKDTNYSDACATYCVELIADELEKILDANTFLYKLMPVGCSVVFKSLDLLDMEVWDANENMSEGLPTIEKHPCYGAEGDDALSVKLLRKLDELFDSGAGVSEFLLNKKDIVCIADRYASIRHSRISHQILNHVSEHYDDRDVKQALKGMTAEGCQQFIRLTGFEVSPSFLRKLGPSPFFMESARHKRKAAEADLGEADMTVKRKDTKEQADGDCAQYLF